MKNETFLFNNQRDSRTTNNINDSGPIIKWEFLLRANPLKGPESTPAVDNQGNIYFGSHDGCFYSVDVNGKYRWMFKTDEKIYSSPAIYMNKVYFCGGDGFTYCLDLYGNLIWKYNMTPQSDNLLVVKIRKITTLFSNLNPTIKRLRRVKSWTSPLLEDNKVYTSSKGYGAHCLNAQNGSIIWKFKLRGSKNHLSGFALFEKKLFICSQKKNVYCINSYGKLIWSKSYKPRYEHWSNPSIDAIDNSIYIVKSMKEKASFICKYSLAGDLMWIKLLDTAIRGSIAISKLNWVTFGGFDGNIYFLNKTDGSLIKKIKLSDADRALWTTPVIDANSNILITTKISNNEGSLVAINSNFEVIWILNDIGKCLSTPKILENGDVLIGSWQGKFFCIKTGG